MATIKKYIILILGINLCIIQAHTTNVSSGSSPVSSCYMDTLTGQALDNSGTLILKKNLVNGNASTNSLGTGTVELSGTTTQTISGVNIIQNLRVNNAAGIIIGGNTRLNGTLIMSNGRVTLDSHNLMLGASSTYTGTVSSSVMIVATGTGELRKEFTSGFTGSFIFPVGDNTGTPEYSPVTLNVSGGTFTTGNYIGVSLKNEKYADPSITGNYLNRYWTLTKSGVSGLICNTTFTYLAADVNGTERLMSCTEVNPSPWVVYALTDTVSHKLTASKIETFGSFTGVKPGIPPTDQNLVNIDIPNGVNNCYDATHVLTVAGNGTTFLVESGGEVTLIAGGSILLMEGTHISSGGYFHAYVTTDGNYCGSTSNPLVDNLPTGDDQGIGTEIKNQSIRIYPNPTSDIVIVELLETGTTASAILTLYNMQGVRLLQKTITGEPRFQLSLLGKPDGIYLVQVQSGNRLEIAKVLKH